MSTAGLCKWFIIFTIKCMCHLCSCVTFQLLVSSHALLVYAKEPGLAPVRAGIHHSPAALDFGFALISRLDSLSLTLCWAGHQLSLVNLLLNVWHSGKSATNLAHAFTGTPVLLLFQLKNQNLPLCVRRISWSCHGHWKLTSHPRVLENTKNSVNSLFLEHCSLSLHHHFLLKAL